MLAMTRDCLLPLALVAMTSCSGSLSGAQFEAQAESAVGKRAHAGPSSGASQGSRTPTSSPCNGGGVSWTTVATDTLAAPNRAYVVSGAERVALTLPATPSLSVGDEVRVVVRDPIPVRVVPAAGQRIEAPDLPWMLSTRDVSRNWQAVASSFDGTKLVAVVFEGRIYTSSDSGTTWTPRESDRPWGAVASSGDGARLVAAEIAERGRLYTSHDSGQTWTPRITATAQWADVAASSDGVRLVATQAGPGGRIYVSADSGQTWTATGADSVWGWGSVVSSSSGSRLVAQAQTETNCALYSSIDFGSSWAPLAGAVFRNCRGLASSSDGRRLALVTEKTLYFSDDYGLSWTPRQPDRPWRSIASSDDGRRLVAGVAHDLYVSSDFGVTWTPMRGAGGSRRVPETGNLRSLAVSGDGRRIFASEYSLGEPPAPLYVHQGTGALAVTSGPASMDLVYAGAGVFFARNADGAVYRD